ncbi:SNF2 family N-terminal domain-containing protein [Lasiosphaeris hirsuta]|uniref:SNF2 family N-terminal domain-containing protein n=1 Tax=Lasiosphaeris hirsuta TaxID=260670 RepID=A0AA39ZYD8_9PEZI|nr:SNF2 family N-terminal domain-containing protein [Lasiosphaeris hirsuta]
MSSCSTPKRRCESDEDDGWSESADLSFMTKRSRQLEPPFFHQPRSGSRSPSQSLQGQSWATDIQPNPSDNRVSSNEIGMTDHTPAPLSQRLPALPTSWDVPPNLSHGYSRASNHILISSPPQDDQICFGILTDIRILVSRRLKSPVIVLDSDEFQRINGVAFTYLKLVMDDDHCQLMAKGVSIATINKKSHFALRKLSSYPLEYLGIAKQQELQQKLIAAEVSLGTGVSNLSCTISLLLSGPRSISDALAKELSKHRLFLQHPNPKPIGVDYENPQYLGMVGSWLPRGPLLTPLSTESAEQPTDQSSDVNPDDEPEVDLKAVMDNLPKHSYLREADITEGITATLKRHQRQAVGFIMSRENTQNENLSSLWRLENCIRGSPVYKHIITGTMDKMSKDLLGGILADGMGLGKTLSMIASVVATLPYAEKFGIGQPSNDDYEGLKPRLSPTRSTLVIVPSVLLLDGWIEEIKKHVILGTLTYFKYHGVGRCLPSSGPLPYNIVFSTYGTVTADFMRGGGVLECFHWYRLVLDEAHVIRNSSTKQFKAITALSATHRWCMTGTPIQNSLDDLSSLVRFLRLPLLEDPATFQKHIAGGRQVYGGVAKPKYANLKLLLGSICLRRSTSAILSDLGVAFVERRPRFSDAERKAYDEMAASCEKAIKAAVNSRSLKKNGKFILTAVLRLRIFCNTGLTSSIVSTNPQDEIEDQFRPDEVISLLHQSGEAVCSKCDTEITSPEAADDHGQQWGTLGSHSRLRCPSCSRRDIDSDSHGVFNESTGDSEDIIMESVPVDDRVPTSGRYSSKVMAVLADVKERYSEEKSIVFSFWRRSLNLLGELFLDEGVVFGRVDGGVDPAQRKKILADFHDDPSMRVLLMTIGTGAIGLNNLSVASRVHILEPQWNPYAEDQAIGRVFRMGQNKNVRVFRYIMEMSVEEMIESRQMFKIQLALKGGLQTSGQELSEGQRRVEQLRQLGKIIGSTIVNRSGP